MTANRPLAQGEGRLAVVVSATDLTDLFVVSGQGLKYNLGKSFPLPPGATELTVYLVAPGDDWREVSRFPLRVGGGDNAGNASTANSFESLLPRNGVTIPAGRPIDLAWAASPQAAFYRLEIEDENGKPILSAMLKSSVRNYRAPSWFRSKVTTGNLRWRVVAMDRAGQYLGETEKRRFQIAR